MVTHAAGGRLVLEFIVATYYERAQEEAKVRIKIISIQDLGDPSS